MANAKTVLSNAQNMAGVQREDMLLSNYGNDDELNGRAMYLARYFPNTVAKIAELNGY